MHPNNLENLAEEDAAHAAAIVRDLRGACLLAEGYHWLLVGTTEAMRTVVAAQPQVRSVFDDAGPTSAKLVACRITPGP